MSNAELCNNDVYICFTKNNSVSYPNLVSVISNCETMYVSPSQWSQDFTSRFFCFSHIKGDVSSDRTVNTMATIGKVIVYNPLHIHHTPQIGTVLEDGLLNMVAAVSLLYFFS